MSDPYRSIFEPEPVNREGMDAQIAKEAREDREEINALKAERAALRQAITLADQEMTAAMGQFDFYVAQHRMKSPPDEVKAMANLEWAKRLETAISAIRRALECPTPTTS
jgi:hypothetical protein